jgi:transposase
MKKKLVIVGIDVSKDTLDVFIYGLKSYFKVANSPKGFVKLLEKVISQSKCQLEDILFCFENTGKYSKPLSVFLYDQSIAFVMESALRIKKSLGLTRGKNDKIDSKRIATYAYEKRESLTTTILPGKKVDQIKSLLTLREKLIKHRTAYKNGLTDLNDCYAEGENDTLKSIQKKLVKDLNEQILIIEKEIKNIIISEESLKVNFKLLKSIIGIGDILSFHLIAFTSNFTSFVDSRSFACYSGIAPFENSSGTKLNKSKIHPYGNKRLKTLLNLAAMSAIQRQGEFKIYYNHRVNEQNKTKMSTMNIIRNKLLSRAFAVIARGTPYVNIHKFAA